MASVSTSLVTLSARLRELSWELEPSQYGILRSDLDTADRRLRLPRPPYASLLGPHCWLAGGSLLRWIVDGLRPGEGDYDLFFPSRSALQRAATDLASSGCTIRRASIKQTTFKHLAHKARVFARHLQKRPDPDAPPPFERWDSPDATAWLASTAHASWLLVLEFATPAGDTLQLVGGVMSPSPEHVLATFDYSICQLAMDDRYLYLGPHTLSDIVHRRLRLIYAGYPPIATRRLFKYVRRGYRPSVQTLRDLGRSYREGGSWP